MYSYSGFVSQDYYFQENFIDIYNEIDDGIIIWFSNFYF